MINIQNDFGDGMDLLSDDTQISSSGYRWSVNAINRFGYIEPTKKHLKLNNAPLGIKQGIIGVGNILVMFVAGKAYYQLDGTTQWIQIPSFQMDAIVSTYFTLAVPASTFHFVRKLAVNIHAPIIGTADFKVAGTPAGIIVQDGLNQPWIIVYGETNQIFFSRKTKTYNEWANVSITADDREYVPIGRQMMLLNDSTLMIVARDGKSVFRSITGRPLDFMVNVDFNGNKLPSESDGGASSVAFAMDFDEITCITNIDIPDSFVYGTAHNTRIVTADYNNTIFGEPTFRVAILLKGSGIVNQYSFTDTLSDYAIIGFYSVKSFNAVQYLKFQGRNSIFSLNLSKLLYNPRTKKTIKQRHCIATNWNNFALFQLDTLWGNLVAMFDTLRQKWVGLSITKAVKIKQFAFVETVTETKLYAITELNEAYQMFGSTETEVAELRIKGMIPSQQSRDGISPIIALNTEHKSAYFRPMFNGGTTDGICNLIEYVDDEESINNRSQATLKAKTPGIPYPVRPPVIPSNLQLVDNPSFSISQGLIGKKISFILQWTNNANLVEFHLITSSDADNVPQKQKNEIFESTYKQ